MTICPRPERWYRIQGCNFQPRYSEGPAAQLSPEQIRAVGDAVVFSDEIAETIASMARGTRTYEGDICTKCGKRSDGELEKRPEETK